MTEVASAAAVGRRPLPALSNPGGAARALTTMGLTEAGDRLAEAKLESVPPLEALAAAIRTIAVVGDRYIVLLEPGIARSPPPGAKRTVVDPSSA